MIKITCPCCGDKFFARISIDIPTPEIEYSKKKITDLKDKQKKTVEYGGEIGTNFASILPVFGKIYRKVKIDEGMGNKIELDKNNILKLNPKSLIDSEMKQVSGTLLKSGKTSSKKFGKLNKFDI